MLFLILYLLGIPFAIYAFARISKQADNGVYGFIWPMSIFILLLLTIFTVLSSLGEAHARK